MKKAAFLMFVSVLAVGMVGCSSKKNPGPGVTPVMKKQSEKKSFWSFGSKKKAADKPAAIAKGSSRKKSSFWSFGSKKNPGPGVTPVVKKQSEKKSFWSFGSKKKDAGKPTIMVKDNSRKKSKWWPFGAKKKRVVLDTSPVMKKEKKSRSWFGAKKTASATGADNHHVVATEQFYRSEPVPVLSKPTIAMPHLALGASPSKKDWKAHPKTVKEIKGENVQKIYYASGKIKSELVYAKGVRHGASKGYYENGQVMYIDTYNNGKHLTREKFDRVGQVEYRTSRVLVGVQPANQ